MKVAIIGANGKIGRIISKKMSASENFEPTAVIRKEEQQPHFEEMGVATVLQSLEENEEAIAQSLKGFDAVVFTAGSGASTGFDKTLEVDLYGAVKSIGAAKKNGVKHFVMVSAAMAGSSADAWPEGMRPYYIAKQLADKELIQSGLEYTILRPVRLTDDEEGKVSLHDDPKELKNMDIPRASVAELVLSALSNPASKGKIMEASKGDMEIEKAVKDFASQN